MIIIAYNFLKSGYEPKSVPEKFICWSSNPKVTIFGDGAYKEEIEIKWGHKDEAAILLDFFFV